MKLEPLGDAAVVATLGEEIGEPLLASVLGLARAVAGAGARGIVDVVPAYATVTVFYDPLQAAEPGGDAYAAVCGLIASCAAGGAAGAPGPAPRTVEIPVCYGGEHGPDLALVAERAAMGPDAAAALHAGAHYRVHAIGFTPGFPFLAGLPAALATPRRATPRPRVPVGSVGIGGAQTGVYPIASPGGWQIIGRTPLALFRPGKSPAALLAAGDAVRFRPISDSEFASWK